MPGAVIGLVAILGPGTPTVSCIRSHLFRLDETLGSDATEGCCRFPFFMVVEALEVLSVVAGGIPTRIYSLALIATLYPRKN